MTYVVTRGIGVAVVEVIPTLEAALERAGQLLSDNYANVAIHDGKGNRIRRMPRLTWQRVFHVLEQTDTLLCIQQGRQVHQGVFLWRLHS
jgi:hypothetical protein